MIYELLKDRIINGGGEGPTPIGTKNITDLSLTDVAAYANAQVVDEDIVAENIKKDVNILGVVGSYEAPAAVINPLSITANGTYTAPSGTDGYSPITVNVPSSGHEPTQADLTKNLTSNMDNFGANGAWDFILRYWKNDVSLTTKSLVAYFADSTETPAQINCNNVTNMNNFMLNNTSTTVPTLTGSLDIQNNSNSASSIMQNAQYIVDASDLFDENLTQSATSIGGPTNFFYNCVRLRKAPNNMSVLSVDKINTSSANVYGGWFYHCCVLDELTNIPNIGWNSSFNKNLFNGSSFSKCFRLKNLIWKTPTASIIYLWSNQSINLSDGVGYAPASLVTYGMPANKEVTDAASYAALKNDDDWWTQDIAYSRYNKTSALATINSLPNCNTGSSNTITFKGTAGSATGGGAINTMTAAEIAVATDRGWTVAFV